MAKRRGGPRPTVGWREWVRLEDLTTTPIKAKIDTGARTSSLHAFGLALRDSPDGTVATFEVHPLQRSAKQSDRVEIAVQGFRDIRSSSGHQERRPVIRTPITLGGHRFDIDITLTSRDEMGFRMLLGRVALRNRFLIDPGRSFCLGDNP